MKAGNGAQRNDRIEPTQYLVAPLRYAPGFHYTLDHELFVFLNLVSKDPVYADQEVLADSAYWGKIIVRS